MNVIYALLRAKFTHTWTREGEEGEEEEETEGTGGFPWLFSSFFTATSLVCTRGTGHGSCFREAEFRRLNVVHRP